MDSGSQKRFKKVYIEISNICNLHCDFCPEVDREKNVMGPDLFIRTLDQIAPLTEQVCFHLMGEPLSHPLFADFVGYCAERNISVNITTNGTLLTPERIDALLHPTVSQVNFSIHSYQSNFPNKDIGPYLNKIFDFTRRAFQQRPDLYINYRLWNLTGKDEHQNAEILSSIEVAFGCEAARSVDVRWRKGRHLRERLYLHFDSRFDWPSPQAPVRSTSGRCHALSSHIGILSDGTVVPCCLDKEGVLALGQSSQNNVTDILMQNRATRMLEGFKSGRLVEDLCQRCTFISRFDKKKVIHDLQTTARA
jgi:MoaA/NifB/PqqE/SkfB family radical SAM enzyme